MQFLVPACRLDAWRYSNQLLYDHKWRNQHIENGKTRQKEQDIDNTVASSIVVLFPGYCFHAMLTWAHERDRMPRRQYDQGGAVDRVTSMSTPGPVTLVPSHLLPGFCTKVGLSSASRVWAHGEAPPSLSHFCPLLLLLSPLTLKTPIRETIKA